MLNVNLHCFVKSIEGIVSEEHCWILLGGAEQVFPNSLWIYCALKLKMATVWCCPCVYATTVSIYVYP